MPHLGRRGRISILAVVAAADAAEDGDAAHRNSDYGLCECEAVRV